MNCLTAYCYFSQLEKTEIKNRNHQMNNKKAGSMVIAVPQFFTRGSSFELPLVLWVFYRVKIKLLKFFFQTNSLELFCVNVELSNLFFLNVERNSPINRRSSQSRFVSELRSCCGLETLLI